jgi:hypothetical protein
MTVAPEAGPDADALVAFVRRADALAWPKGLVAEGDDLPGFLRTTVDEGDLRFVDLFGGARTDIGLEVVFWKGKQIWGASYRGGLSDPAIDLNEAYDFLIRALGARDEQQLPIRGPGEYEESPWSYRHALKGTFGAFSSMERMYVSEVQVYERITIGGWSGDDGSYGPSLGLPELP